MCMHLSTAENVLDKVVLAMGVQRDKRKMSVVEPGGKSWPFDVDRWW